MRILFAASSLDAAGSLPLAMKRAGHEVAICVPYPTLADGVAKPTRVRIPIRLGAEILATEVLEASSEDRVPCYLARLPAGIVTGTVAEGIWFSQIVLELARRLTPLPSAIHLRGWLGGLAPAYNRLAGLPFRFMQALESHALEGGSFEPSEFALANLPVDWFSPHGAEFFGRFHFPKASLLFADALVADSTLGLATLCAAPAGIGRVVAEQSHKAASGLEPLLEEEWSPATDVFLVKRYRATTLGGKGACRAALLASLELAREPRGPIFLLDRRTSPAPLGAAAAIFDRVVASDARLVVLGANLATQPAIAIAARRYAGRVALVPTGNETLEHEAVAGSDFAWFPQPLAPGLPAAIQRALTYGTLPIATAQPGLEEFFADLRPVEAIGEGLVCHRADESGWWDTVGIRAAALARDSASHDAAVVRAMRRVASRNWEASAARHTGLLGRVVA